MGINMYLFTPFLLENVSAISFTLYINPYNPSVLFAGHG